MKTYLYIDGFNLYYGALKKYPEMKWLNPKKLAEIIQPKCEIAMTRYFTAKLEYNEEDPKLKERQNDYLDALREEIPNIDIKEGIFKKVDVIGVKKNEKSELKKYLIKKYYKFFSVLKKKSNKNNKLRLKKCMKFFYSFKKRRKKIIVETYKEKGSDVNLAVHLLNDAWEDSFDCAILISDDSDLVEAVRLVWQKRKKIIHISPRNTRLESPFKRYIKKPFHIKYESLEKAQMPDRIPRIGKKDIKRPSSWR